MAVDEGLPEISVVGASLRLPGSPDVDAFWQLLSEGRSAISRVTPDRWPVERYYHPKRTMRGRSYSAVAGLIEGLWDFDPDLFGISPREAAQMDPQQRLTLMVAWEALEAAGLPPTRLPRERTGVYVGASGTEHGSYFYADLSRSDAQGMTGSTLSIISNRLSHIFDLQGPSYTVDTACSSSLFALDHAVTALQRRDVDVAIVAGVNVCLAALAFIGFSAANMLSARGQIHAFDARADGYVRGEGAVALVLKRQEEAARDGDPELAVIGATGTMSTGLGSGLTRPSAARQASLIGAVARRLPSPEALGFVEAHGTGTPVGDPEEALAIGQTLAQGRQTPLPFGSVKTNIGHLEPASGLAGLMKAILALRHGILPPSLNFETPNPAIDFEALNVAVATAPTPLSLLADGAPLHALVNSFGFGGANASVLLRASTRTPEADAGAASGCEPEALLLSAASEASLQRQIEAWRTRLENADTAETARLVTTANHRRARLGHRVVALRPAGGRLVEGLRRDAELVTGRSRVGRTGLAVETGTAFVFSGNGSQYLGMGAHLYEEDPVYKETFDAVAELFRAEDPAQDIHAWLADPALETHMGMATRAQPMLFALQAGLVATLEHHGLRPDATAGHSIGEACAAWAAGAIPLEQAVQIIASRAPLLQALHGTGTMAAALCDAATIAEIIEEEALTGVYLSGENSPRSSTISGTVEGIGLFERAAKRRRVAVRRLDIAYPYHSPACDPLHDAFMQALNRLTPQETPVLYASSTEGALLPGDRLDIGYWWRNIREPVRFRPAVAALRDAGMGVFIEIGPRPVLKSYVTDSVTAEGRSAAVLSTLEKRGMRSEGTPRAIVAEAFAHGATIEEARLLGEDGPAATGLPAYPWSLAHYRVADTPTENDPIAPPVHPLLGAKESARDGEWRSLVDLHLHPWLADHRVAGTPLLPATAFADIALAAGEAVFGTGAAELVDLDILARLAVSETEAVTLRTIHDRSSGVLTIESRPQAGGDWTLHARGTVRGVGGLGASESLPVPLGVGGGTATAGAALYERLTARGLEYGPAFRLLRDVMVEGDRAWLTLDPPPAPLRDTVVEPTSLDAALHGLLALIEQGSEHGSDAGAGGGPMVPIRLGRLRRADATGVAVSAMLTLRRASDHGLAVDLTLSNEAGAPVATVEDLRLQRLPLPAPRHLPGLWTEERIDLDPGETVALDPAPLIARGILSSEPASATDIALLLDALARRGIWDCLADGAEQGLPSAVAQALLGVLAEDDGPPPGRETEAPYPEMAVLIDSLIALAPEQAGEMRRVLHALAGLRAHGLETPPPAPLPAELALADPDREAIFAAAEAALSTLLETRPPGARCRVLILGAPEPWEIARLAQHPRLGLLTVSDPDEGRLELLAHEPMLGPRARLTPLSELTEPGSYDALLCLPSATGKDMEAALARSTACLIPGAPVLVIEPDRDLAGALVASVASDWASFASWRGEGPLGQAASTLSAAGRLQMLWTHPVTAAARAMRCACYATPVNVEPVLREPERESEPAIRLLPLAAGTVSDGLAARLSRYGLVVSCDPEKPGDVILAAGPEFEAASPSDVADAILRMRDALQAGPARLWLLLPASDNASVPLSAPAAALRAAARSAGNEFADAEIRVIACAAPERDAARIAALILAPGVERELLVTSAGLSAWRTTSITAPAPGDPDVSQGMGQSLSQARRGDLSSLRWQPCRRRAPGEGEIEIAVAATGLNFRDVMWAQGLLPAEALEDGYAGASFGMECAGTVLRAGPGARYAPGDRVVALAPQSFASHVIVSDRAAIPVPEAISLEAGAALPVAFLTAHYALREIARLEAGETVLIHGGAGGVGLAALQVAQAAGARVLATAGSPDKRNLLRGLGAEAVFDSRSLGFADAIKARFPDGIDVVLNSLSGAAMERSVELLGPFGRFVELGKRDFYANSRIALRPFRRNVSFSGVDVDQLMGARATVAERILDEITARLADGSYTPLGYARLPSAATVPAMRLMQKSGHVGKIVVAAETTPEPTPTAPSLGTGAWLVTGGLAGLGLATVEWLYAQGVRRFWLVSRSGAAGSAETARIEALRQGGAVVETVAADVADPAAMTALFERIGSHGPLEGSLEGIVHAAAVFSDRLLREETAENLESVLSPKLAGARLLDQLSRAVRPAHFILYSSVAARIGNPAQAGYAAANAALDALAQARRAEGLPALSIAWTPISDTGVLASRRDLRDRLARKLDGALMTSADAMSQLGRLLSAPPVPSSVPSSVIAGPMPWGQIAADLPFLATPGFERLSISRRESVTTEGEDLQGLLARLGRRKALPHLIALVTEQLAVILRQPAGEIDAYRPLGTLGVDSLMAMDLRMGLEERLGRTIPLFDAGGEITIADLCQRLLDSMEHADAEPDDPRDEDERVVEVLAQRHLKDGSGTLDRAMVAQIAGTKRRSLG